MLPYYIMYTLVRGVLTFNQFRLTNLGPLGSILEIGLNLFLLVHF